ncbi:MAG: hypothetical protein OEZ39_14620 [Gammaproteobacteria bacterium]|nr:hypothetical protein [Gammaproteobacteria bacterium]
MAVIINEMEVVTETPESPPGEGTNAAAEQTGNTNERAMSPLDIDCVMRMRYQRLARVRAD